MLLISYIIAGALELALTVQTYRMGYGSYAWSFGFLLLLSISSIPVETSTMGKLIRTEFKKMGVNTAQYDFLTNSGKIIFYVFILKKIISYIMGLILAYLTTFIFLVIVIWKYSQIDKNNIK